MVKAFNAIGFILMVFWHEHRKDNVEILGQVQL